MTASAPAVAECCDFIAIVIPGEAVPFARAGAHGKVRFTPPAQRAQMKAIGMLANRQMAGAEPFDGPIKVQIRATYEPPKSWSRAKQGQAKWKTSLPDADNLAKLVLDSLNGIVWIDDARVCDLSIQKRYGLKSETVVTVMQLRGEA